VRESKGGWEYGHANVPILPLLSTPDPLLPSPYSLPPARSAIRAGEVARPLEWVVARRRGRLGPVSRDREGLALLTGKRLRARACLSWRGVVVFLFRVAFPLRAAAQQRQPERSQSGQRQGQ